ncbi:hypothetical protein Bca4012_091993 [Brassica carinata]|uniref:Uncharacterized protein n=1 Tax=Brassica carinata TaxID=52824 RepID=A0A8X7UUV3_BRACI|nr:hypothetical protein Bca52824_038343 [Brassica carinata]
MLETTETRGRSTAAPPSKGSITPSAKLIPSPNREEQAERARKRERSRNQSPDLTPDPNPRHSTRPEEPHIHSSALFLRRSKSDAPDLTCTEAQRHRSTEKETEERRKRRGEKGAKTKRGG